MAGYRIVESSVNSRIDRVDIAVAAVDAFSGDAIFGGLAMSIEGIVKQPIRNLSGMWVFINLPERAQYQLNIDASSAGYFNPPTIVIGAEDQPRVDVALVRLPSASMNYEASYIAGTVKLSDQKSPAALVTITANFPEEDGNTASVFRSFSDEKGAFLLPCRVPDLVGDDQRVISLSFILAINGHVESRRLTRKLLTSRLLSFDRSIVIPGPDIDLDDEGPEVPALIKGAK